MELREPGVWIKPFLALALAGMFVACTPPPTPSPPGQPATPTAPISGGTPGTPGLSTAPPGGTAVDTEACADLSSTAVQLPVYANPPDLTQVPGAEPEADQLNEGDRPPTATDPNGVPLADPSLVPIEIVPPGAEDPNAPDAVTFLEPVRTVTGANTGMITEPHVARSGATLFLTWNKGTAQSFDSGATLQYLNPEADLEADTHFCCDQLADYLPAYDMWLWVLQYRRLLTETGRNRIRLAVASSSADFAARRFHYWDFVAQDAGFADGVWLDQTKLGVTDHHVFLSINAYNAKAPFGNGSFRGAVVYRLPIDQLMAGGQLTPTCMTTRNQFDASGYPIHGPYPVAKAKDTMFIAGHVSNSTLAIWRWPDGDAAPTKYLITDSTYNGAWPWSCPTDSAAAKTTDWCGRSDDRMHSGWLNGSEIGFAWNVGPQPLQDRPYPYTWVVRLDTNALGDCATGACVVGHVPIFSQDTAYQYGTLALNGSGGLGAIVQYGGGKYSFGCQALIRDERTASGDLWNYTNVRTSDRDPFEAGAGDYLGIVADAGGWTATCVSVDATQPTRPVSVHVSHFGRNNP
jgi:hypothetical protein